MGKRIIVFCDGTGNDQLVAASPTNIRIMYEHIIPNDNDIICYFPGVGVDFTAEPNSSSLRIDDSIKAKSFNYIIKNAYSFISRNYKDGDEIYLFGFSRGSAAVRSLSNFIRTCGLHHHGQNINVLFEIYQKFPKDLQKTAESAITITFMGIFDTVPGLTDSDIKEHDFTFHEGFHKRYCHLMASDITSNYHNLPFNKFVDFNNIPLLEVSPNVSLQVYCPGDHCNVGGGWFTSHEVKESPVLSNNTLKCMVVSSGLEFSPLTDFPCYGMDNWKEGVKTILDLEGAKGYIYNLTQLWSDFKSSKNEFDPIKFLFDNDDLRLNRIGKPSHRKAIPLAAPQSVKVNSSKLMLRSAGPSTALLASAPPPLPPQEGFYSELPALYDNDHTSFEHSYRALLKSGHTEIVVQAAPVTESEESERDSKRQKTN
jgi:hypothetical protein